LYPYANISSFCFSLAFVAEVAKVHSKKMPLHLAYKAAACMRCEAEGLMAVSQAWKFEKFIFEILPLSHRVGALWYPREQCFAPLKNAGGDDSPETVREALQEADRRAFTLVSGVEPPCIPFELSLEFYYPTTKLLAAWHGKSLPAGGGYIPAF
jgi:UDP-N-acetylglucosamine/UDP-N-acetylgalactosamine diphosphorylase